MKNTIQWYLEQWGIWQRIGNALPRYISPSYVLMSDNMQRSRNTLSPLITDDECLVVDRLIAQMAIRDETKARAVFLFYAHGLA